MLLISLVIRLHVEDVCESRRKREKFVAYVLNGSLENLNAFIMRSFKIDRYLR